jgi:phosphatidylglycerophosphatase A
VRHLERLPEGVGIVVDDVAAGLYGLALMQLVLHFALLPR